ncbi:MAG TPA: ABC transporter permease [Puia sp.]|jgi:putative ABC transport system permease protein|nr:ABC transporter permease [Puia sp.]
MFLNYWKLAWRNMLNNKVYSTLNILGLAMGMAVALLLSLWVHNQFSYDRFLPNADQLYQVNLNFTDPHEGTHTQPGVNLPLAVVLRNTIPGIEKVAETDWVSYESHDLLVRNKKFLLNGGCVNPDFLDIFQYPLVKGTPATLLKDVYSIVITESTAKALFGNEDPMNKTIHIDNRQDVRVTGVLKDIPANATLQFGYLLPFSFKQATQNWMMKNAYTEWNNNSFEIFVKLKPGVTNAQVAGQIKDIVYKNNPPVRPVKPEVILHSLKDWHLYSDFKNGKAVGGFIDYVRMFGIIGALVLLIACINFINLATARSEKRAREVGVRKAIGSQRSDLIYQFLTESLLITFAAFLLSLLFVQLSLPYFNSLTRAAVTIPYASPLFWGVMLVFVLATGLLAGSRPAFYLSSFNPVKVLKGAIKEGRAAALPRKILVVAQFSCSVALIISTIIIYQQLQYAKNRPTGYTVDRLVSTPLSGDLGDKYDALKNDLLASGMVEAVTKASSPLTGIYWHTGIDKWPGKQAGELGINVGGLAIADNYFNTVGMKLIKGRDFTSDWAHDTADVIINEAAANRMGLKQPIGQYISWAGLAFPCRIVGVVHDALMESPFKSAEATVFIHGSSGNFVIYRLSAGVDPHAAIQKLTKIFDKYNPAYPYSYSFVDLEYAAKFNLENLVGTLAGLFSALAIFISCLGLFGLAAYTAEQRMKEISIRKVLGASLLQVWVLLSRDFVVLVFLSCVLASPVAFYFLRNWLDKYPYRISIGAGVFFMAAAIALLITVLTISFQAIKAGLRNPALTLRSE